MVEQLVAIESKMNKELSNRTRMNYLPMVQNLVVVVVDHNLDIHHIHRNRHNRHNLDNILQEVHTHWHLVVVHSFVLPKEQVRTLMM